MLNINSESSVKVFIQMLEDTKFGYKWIWHSFFNLRWNYECKTLYHCGIGGMNSFESILKCPYVDSRRITKYHEETDLYLKNGYSLILPISTEKIGIPGKNFYHNIFVDSEYDDNNVLMFDFWAPEFKWKEKIWEKEKIIQGIYEIEERKQYAIALKNNGNNNEVQLAPYINDYISEYRNTEQNTGINVYERIIEWIQNMESIYHLNHVVFVSMEEHFGVWKSITKAGSLEYKLIEEAIKKAKSLRNLSIKYWYSKKINNGWKEELVNRVNEIRLFEMEIIDELEKTNMRI